MNSSKSTIEQILESFRKQSQLHGGTTALTSMPTFGEETTRYYGRKRETSFGYGTIVFDGKARLSPVARAILSLFEPRTLPKRSWFDPKFPQMRIRVRRNTVPEKAVTEVLAKLLPGSRVIRSSREKLYDKLKKSNIEISTELKRYIWEEYVEQADDFLLALKEDSGSNICVVEFEAATMYSGVHGEYAEGYVMRLSELVTMYSSTPRTRSLATELELALGSGDAKLVEDVLVRMIQDVFVSIRHEGLRSCFAERLLQGRALKNVASEKSVVSTPASNMH